MHDILVECRRCESEYEVEIEAYEDGYQDRYALYRGEAEVVLDHCPVCGYVMCEEEKKRTEAYLLEKWADNQADLARYGPPCDI